MKIIPSNTDCIFYHSTWIHIIVAIVCSVGWLVEDMVIFLVARGKTALFFPMFWQCLRSMQPGHLLLFSLPFSSVSFHSAPFFSLFRHLKASFIYWDKSHQLGKYICDIQFWYFIRWLLSIYIVFFSKLSYVSGRCFRLFVKKMEFATSILPPRSALHSTTLLFFDEWLYFSLLMFYCTLLYLKRKQNKKRTKFAKKDE